MNVYAWVLLAALAVSGAASWWAGWSRRPDVEQLARPVFAVILVALAWLLRADSVGYGRWLLLGLVVGQVWEYLVATRRDRSVGPGLLVAGAGSMAAYLLAIATMPRGAPTWVGVAALAVVGSVVAARWIGPKVPRYPDGGAPWARPLLAYLALLTVVTAAGWYAGHALLAVALTTVAGAHALLVVDLAVRPIPGGRLAGVTLHQLAQVGVVVGMLRAWG